MNKYLELKKVFELNSTDEKQAMEDYMKNNFIFYGINAKKRKELEKDFIKHEKNTKKIDWDFLKECYNDPHREMHYFVLDCLLSEQKFLTINDLDKLEYFIKNNQWWDSIDKLDKIIGNIDCHSKVLDNLMLKWSTHKNMWYRRLSIDHQQNRKEKTNTKLLELIIKNNLGTTEFFINKAIGWSLREYSKVNKDWVKKFIEANKSSLSKLSIKEASIYL